MRQQRGPQQWPEDGIITDHDVVDVLLKAVLEGTTEYPGLDFPGAPDALTAARRWATAIEANRMTNDAEVISPELLRAALFIAFKLGLTAGRNYQSILSTRKRKV